MSKPEGKITAIYLDSGKKIVPEAVRELGSNFVVKLGPRTVLVVPGSKIQSVETEFETEAALAEVFGEVFGK